jgi:hypothetical protein
VSYVVSSRGRPIGVSDLGFIRISRRFRSGWFYPNEYGEQVMPVISSTLPAMRAYLHRDVLGDDGQSIVQPDLADSTLFRNLAEALERVEALDLTLHRDDGTLVPTEVVGIQDIEQLLALPPLNASSDDEADEWTLDDEEWSLDEACYSPSDKAFDGNSDTPFDLDIDDDLIFDGDRWDDIRPWTPPQDPSTFPRYQIHVVLADGDIE